MAAIKSLFPANLPRRIQLGQSEALSCRVSAADPTSARPERDWRAFAKRLGYRIAGVWKATAPGARGDRAERKKSWRWSRGGGSMSFW